MKKSIVVFVVLAVAAVTGLGLWQFYFKDVIGTPSSEETAYVQPVSALTSDVLGSRNWYAGVIEAQKTVQVNIESGRTVSEVKVSVGDRVKPGDLLFEYDLSSIQDSLKTAQLEFDELLNAAMGYQETILNYQKELMQPNLTTSQILSTTIALEQSKMDLTKNEYSQIRKQNEIQKLEAAMGNTEVLAEVDGVIQKIDTSKLTSEDGDSLSDSLSYGFGEENNDGFITILGTGNYRAKGMANEINIREFVLGSPVVIRSRVDSTKTWTGRLNSIDEQNASSNNNDDFVGGGDSSMTNSTSYPFYVDLDNSKDLMLGQHVYIEFDTYGQDRPSGLWLDETFVVGADTNAPYVWVQGANGRLQKRSITVGERDDTTGEYQILSGLSTTDYIASPDDYLQEGMRTADISTKTVDEDDDDWEDEDWEDEEEWEVEDWEVNDEFSDDDWEDEDLTELDDSWDSEDDEDDDVTVEWWEQEEDSGGGNRYGSDDRAFAG